jgi:asparagine synthase (glutamine-hydrolysing)
MCGITGIWNWGNSSISSRTLYDMTMSQKHRGPDGHGYFILSGRSGTPHEWKAGTERTPDIDTDVGIGLGHNWLAVQDTGENSRQPMCYGGRYWITFNGEIYNFIELRNDLVGKGYEFRTGSDTEVILALWSLQGEDSISRLRGMFSFIVYDMKSKTMWAVRDRFGIKPLYYSVLPGNTGILFASEMEAFFAPPVVRKRWDEKALVSFLACGINKPDDEKTFFDNIMELPPGNLLRIKAGKIEKAGYYELPDTDYDRTVPLDIRDLRDVFMDTVRIHLRSSKEVGTCLSGGLDSTNIAFAIKRLLGGDISRFKAFTIGSPGSSDILLAKSASGELNVGHHIYDSPEFILKDDLVEMIRTCETPNHTWGPINQYYLLRHISRDHDVPVLLDGQGGDEVFSGYPWFFKTIVDYFTKRNEARTADDLDRLFREKSPLPASILDFSTGIYFSRRKWITSFDGGALSAMGLTPDDVLELEPVRYYLNDELDWQEFRRQEFYRRELQHLLRQEDRLGMRFSIENRVPFLDHVLVEKVLEIGPYDLWKDGYSKHPLRMMFPEMPEVISKNTGKKGFWENYSALPDDLVSYMKEKTASSETLKPYLKEGGLEGLNVMALWRFFQIAVLSE